MKQHNLIASVHKALDAFQKDISKFDEMLALHSKDKCSDAVILRRLKMLNEKYPANPLVLGRLLEFLQLVNDEKILSLYTLADIAPLYSKITGIYKDGVDLNVEHYYYLHNVLDNEKKALQTANKFKKRFLKMLSLGNSNNNP